MVGCSSNILFVSEQNQLRALWSCSSLNNNKQLTLLFGNCRPASVWTQTLSCRSTFEPVAVGVVLAALIYRLFVHNQAHVVVSTPDRREADWVSHLPALHPAGHAQMHPHLSGQENDDDKRTNDWSQVPACTAAIRTKILNNTTQLTGKGYYNVVTGWVFNLTSAVWQTDSHKGSIFSPVYLI